MRIKRTVQNAHSAPAATISMRKKHAVKRLIGMPFFSQHTADLLFEVANWMLAGGTLVVLVGAGLVAWTTPMKEHYSDIRIAANELAAAQADERAANATKDAAVANERVAQAQERIAIATKDAATANERSASANARAAALEKDAAAAKLEQERLKAQLAWRALTPQMISALRAALSQQPGQINIDHAANDTEAMYLAIQLSNIFDDAGWEVASQSATMQGIAFGLRVPDSPSPSTSVVRAALNKAGIPFRTEPPPPMGMSFGNSIQGAPTLFVGTKPPPQ